MSNFTHMLSPEEQLAAARNDFDHITEKRHAATLAARKILRHELDGITWDEMRRDPTRGELASQLFSTWVPVDRSEAVVETAYSLTGIYEDLNAAMQAHGLPSFDAKCAKLGKQIALAAIEYILASHDLDYEAITEEWNQEISRQREDREAEAAEGYWRNRGIDP